MAAWIWVVIAVVVIGALAVAAWALWRERRTAGLRTRFGPEYERTVSGTQDRRKAEGELKARQDRVQGLDIHPVSPSEQARYLDAWRQVQGGFVDQPAGALRDADLLVHDLMHDCGYPMDTFEQRAADVSVDHPVVVQRYRAAHDISTRTQSGEVSIEEMRQGLVHYRALFEELLGEDGSGAREVR
jgi:hypothetical protein